MQTEHTHQKGMQTRKKELHAFVYVADNVYINARRLVSPMCVCVCVCVYKNQKRPNLWHVFYRHG